LLAALVELVKTIEQLRDVHSRSRCSSLELVFLRPLGIVDLARNPTMGHRFFSPASMVDRDTLALKRGAETNVTSRRPTSSRKKTLP
jgi:hypothetical protein